MTKVNRPLKKSLNEAVDTVAERFMASYGTAVLEDRAIPSLEDGLKPVQRRALFAMHKLGLKDTGAYVKSARVVGEVIGKYHAHGDCLSGDTLVYLLSGKMVPIKDLVGKGSRWVLSFDTETNKIVPALAHSWRIGQVTKKTYTISLSNGSSITVTGNHPILVKRWKNTFVWVKAENLSVDDVVVSPELWHTKYPMLKYSKIKPIHKLCGDFFIGKKDGHVYHHKNHNTADNRKKNLERLSRGDHALLHEDYLTGLQSGRDSMFSQAGQFREAIREKNSRLAKEVSKHRAILFALKVVRRILENGDDLTPDNYEKYRKEEYNGTKLSTMLERGFSLEKLADIAYTFKIDTSCTKGLTKPYKTKRKRNKSVKDTDTFKNEPLIKYMADVVLFAAKYTSISQLDWDSYEVFRKKLAKKGTGVGNIHKRAFPKKKTIIHSLRVRSFRKILTQFLTPYVTYVSNITKNKLSRPEPMYDFTVDTTQNMLVCTKDGNEKSQLLVVHNSSCYESMVRLASGIPSPLIDGYGNWGDSITDKAAAYRYTECRFTGLGYNVFFNPFYLRATAMVPNFDGTCEEPVVLPAVYPMFLAIGQSGIAVATTTNIPAFTFKSIKKVTDYILSQGRGNKIPKVTAKFLAKHLEFTSASGGKVISTTEEITELLATGVGRIQWECDYTIKDNSVITITGVPPDWSFVGRTKKLAELPLVAEALDHTDKKGLKYVVRLKKAPEEQRIEYIEKVIKPILQCSSSYRININRRYKKGEGPQSEVRTVFATKSIVDVLNDWFKWRLGLEQKALHKEALLIKEKLARQRLLLTAIDHLDIIFGILQQSRKKKIDKVALLATKLKITPEQSKQIWEISVGRLDGLSRTDTVSAINALRKELKVVANDLKNLPKAAHRRTHKTV